jgi:ABC-2 type transport system ATP-binding protein
VLVIADQLSKAYRGVPALRGVTLQAPRGQVLGLLGPNGAGKSTFIRLLTGFLRPTGGSAQVEGFDCYRQSLEVRRRLAYLPGDARLPRRLDGHQAIDLFSRLRSGDCAARARHYAERLGLNLDRRAGQMSTGMRQQLALAITLAPQTPLVILDEPTANLDPSVRREVLDLVREAGAQGRTVLFSSHVLAEVEQACDRVVILRGGELVEDVAMDVVRRQHVVRIGLAGPLSPLPSDLAQRARLERQDVDAAVLFCEGDLAPLLGWLASQPLRELHVEPSGLSRLYEQHHPPRTAARRPA